MGAYFKGDNVVALKSIIWFIFLMITIVAIYNTVGAAGITCMFPEGKRWWHPVVQLISLVLFALVILFHPFK